MAPLSAILVLCFIALNTFAQPTPAPGGARPEGPPNIVLILCDDLAYSDLGCYGNARAKTPHLDRMAREGIRFTDFYVGQPVCSASRAALMTGCYPGRVGIQGALAPKSKIALHTNEITIAELLKTRGYATAIYGKWHLGHTPEFLPTRQGFDDYFGLPYSNDMWPNHPTSGTNFPPLPLIEGERVIQLMPDQTQLTKWYTERAVRFIDRNANANRPFFLYVPHTMPHVPIHVSAAHKGKSSAGLYADVIMEIDWSVGEILSALKSHGLDEKTIVIFSSDNGPWLEYGNHAGNALPLREGKMTSFEGGFRVPFIARWPTHVPAGNTCRELVTAMDLYPTFAALAGAELPKNRILDGKDIAPLLAGKAGAKSPHEAFFYYWGEQLEAVRSGPWKLHLGHEYIHPDPPGVDGKPGKIVKKFIGASLFDLENDLSETADLAEKNPAIVARLQALAEQCRVDLGDWAQHRTGLNVRPAALVAPQPNTAWPNPNARTVTPEPDGSLLLHARFGYPQGTAIRYEPQPNKNTIGYWTKKDDGVTWDFTIKTSGTYNVEILQGCGKGSGGSKVEFSVGDQHLETTVEDTGGFQNFIPRQIGQLKFDKPGTYSLQVKPITKPGLAVMDLRSVMLTPVRLKVER